LSFDQPSAPSDLLSVVLPLHQSPSRKSYYINPKDKTK
jgi:hypothetical protein